jgi:hypothetical protein
MLINKASNVPTYIEHTCINAAVNADEMKKGILMKLY